MSATVTASVPSGTPRIDLTVAQGATYVAEFTWLVDGVARSLAECSAVMAFAQRVGREPVVTVSSKDGEITLEPDAHIGVISVRVPAAKTALLRSKAPYAYDLIVLRGTEVHRVVEGKVTVRRAVALAG